MSRATRRARHHLPRLFACAVCALLLLPFGLGAQGAVSTPLTLTLDQAVDLALKNNLGIKADRVRLEEKKGDLANNWNVFLPSVTLNAAMSRSSLDDADRVLPYAPTITLPRWGAQLLLDLNWGLGVAQFLSVKQTSLAYNQGLLSTRIAERRLGRQVKKLYYSLVLARESIQIFDQSLALAQKRLDLARAREKIGAASSLDVLAEEVSLESIRPQIIEQRGSYEIALASFKQLLGIHQDTEVSLDGGLAVPAEAGVDPQGLLRDSRSRLDLVSIRGSIDSLRNKIELDKAGLTPSLFVKWTFDPTFQRDPLDPSTWSGVPFLDLWKQSQGALTIGVSIPLDPLLPSSRVRSDIARSELQLAEAELGYQGALEGAEIEVLTLLKQVDKSVQLIAAADKGISLAERLYAGAEKAYENGSKSYLELQDAQNKLNVARFERLRDAYGYLNVLAELEFAVAAGDFASN
jgi:outer membrane protein TolC